MPLVKGRSHAAVSKNVKTLLEEGKAVKSEKKKNPKSK